jgi:uncharacterized membrane protein YedE/YeeE
MFETFGFETVTPQGAAVVLGLALGVLFGALAEVTRFCLRRAVAGRPEERSSAAGVWLLALAAAILGTQLAVAADLVSFANHRFAAADLPWLAVVAGGVMFGAGMVLTRGCMSRLTVLMGSGNLRALTVLLVFAVVAHATLKGVLAPIRTALGSVTVPMGEFATLSALPGGALVWAALLAALAAGLALRSGAERRELILAGLLGLLVPAAWVGTGFVLYDEFDPIAMESLSFTSPAAESLFWSVAATSIPAGFGVGLLGGTIVGAAGSALLGGRFRWQSFCSAPQTGRYVLGAALMGMGGVLAGGCTIGAGLSGVPTLSVAAMLALASIVLGAIVTDRASVREGRATAIPAE